MLKRGPQEEYEQIVQLAGNIQKGMKFCLEKKMKIKDEEADIKNRGVTFKKGMKFEMDRDLKLGKKQIKKDDDIELLGGKKFKFHEDDVLEIDSVDDNHVHFHVERKKKNVKNKQGEKILFSMTIERFLDIFESYADIEIPLSTSLRFKADDIIIVEEVNTIPREDENKPPRIGIVFSVQRNGKKLQDQRDQNVLIRYNGVLFVQRFTQFTNLEEVVSGVSDDVSNVIKK